MQTIICAGDSTIEPPWVKRDTAGSIFAHGVDGHGIQHHCKNVDKLWEVARQSEETPFDSWTWKPGDTVENVFGP